MKTLSQFMSQRQIDTHIAVDEGRDTTPPLVKRARALLYDIFVGENKPKKSTIYNDIVTVERDEKRALVGYGKKGDNYELMRAYLGESSDEFIANAQRVVDALNERDASLGLKLNVDEIGKFTSSTYDCIWVTTADGSRATIVNTNKVTKSRSFQPKIDLLGFVGKKFTSKNEFIKQSIASVKQNFNLTHDDDDAYVLACVGLINDIDAFSKTKHFEKRDECDVDIPLSDDTLNALQRLTDDDIKQISQWFGELLVPMFTMNAMFANDDDETLIEFPSNNESLVDAWVNGESISVKSSLVKPHSPAISAIDATLSTLRAKHGEGNASYVDKETNQTISLSFDPDDEERECELVDMIFPTFNNKNASKGASQEIGCFRLYDYMMTHHKGDVPKSCAEVWDVVTTGKCSSDNFTTLKFKNGQHVIERVDLSTMNQLSRGNKNYETAFVSLLDRLYDYDIENSHVMKSGNRTQLNPRTSLLYKFVHDIVWSTASTNFTQFEANNDEYKIENYEKSWSSVKKYACIVVPLRRTLATMLNKVYCDYTNPRVGCSPMANVIRRIIDVIQIYIGIRVKKDSCNIEIKRMNSDEAEFQFIGTTTNLGDNTWKYIMGFELKH